MKNLIASLLLFTMLGCTYDTEEDAGESTTVYGPNWPCDETNLVRTAEVPRGPMCFYLLTDVSTTCEGAPTRTLHEVRAEARRLADNPYATEVARTVCTNAGPLLEVPLAAGKSCDEASGEFLVADDRPALTACTYHLTHDEIHDPLGSQKWFDGCSTGNGGDPLG